MLAIINNIITQNITIICSFFRAVNVWPVVQYSTDTGSMIEHVSTYEVYWPSYIICDWLISLSVHLLSQLWQGFEHVASQTYSEISISFTVSDLFNEWQNIPFDQSAGSFHGLTFTTKILHLKHKKELRTTDSWFSIFNVLSAFQNIYFKKLYSKYWYNH